MVEKVKECRGKRHAGALRNGNLLRQTQIQVPSFKATQRASARGRISAQLDGAELVTHSLRIREYVQTASASAGAGAATTVRSNVKAAGSRIPGGDPNRLGNGAERGLSERLPQMEMVL